MVDGQLVADRPGAEDLGELDAAFPSTTASSLAALGTGLPVGVQFIAPVREDARMYRAAAGLEAALEKAWGGPLLQRRPAVEDLLAASGEADAEGVSE